MIAGLIASFVSMVIEKHSLFDHLKVQNLHDLYHKDDEPVKPPVTK